MHVEGSGRKGPGSVPGLGLRPWPGRRWDPQRQGWAGQPAGSPSWATEARVSMGSRVPLWGASVPVIGTGVTAWGCGRPSCPGCPHDWEVIWPPAPAHPLAGRRRPVPRLPVPRLGQRCPGTDHSLRRVISHYRAERSETEEAEQGNVLGGRLLSRPGDNGLPACDPEPRAARSPGLLGPRAGRASCRPARTHTRQC